MVQVTVTDSTPIFQGNVWSQCCECSRNISELLHYVTYLSIQLGLGGNSAFLLSIKH